MTELGLDAAESARLAAVVALRSLAGALVEHIADAETLVALTETLTGLDKDLRSGPQRDLKEAMRDSIVTRGAGASAVLERAAGGLANATAVGLQVNSTADFAYAEFVIDPVFFGWPGYAHGGVVAALMDDVLGQMASVTGGFTATTHLEVAFRRPTPTGRPLRIECRPVPAEGNRIVIEGALLDGAEQLVTARGEFAVVGNVLLA